LAPAAARSVGRTTPGWPQDQVLRNQIVGKSHSGARSGPRFVTVIWISRSSGVAFAYSTNTSK
jgi:hypothetical protein